MKILGGLLIIILVFAGCKKNDPTNFDIKTLEFTHIDSENVTAKLLHKFPKGIAEYEMEITIYFGTDPSGDNPVLHESSYNLDGPVKGQFVENEILLQGLNGDQTYYFSARLYNFEYGIDMLTPLTGFNTAPTPNAPCALTTGEFIHDTGVQSTGTLSLSPIADYTLKVSSALGYLEFAFDSEPASGMYSTISNIFDVNSTFKTVHVDGWLEFSGWNCYYSASNNHTFYVHNDNGVIDIEFCDVPFGTSGTGCNSKTISGKFSM